MISQLKINNPWGYLSKIIILAFAILQLLRLVILPQFIDIYYHLQVAWGFIQAGGYSSWDFWEYAPFGRPHIYPPLFHILLALLMKLGAGVIFLAKFFESATPIVFLIILWDFIKKNYSEQLGFFVVIAFSSAFAFFISLSNHIPATLALVFGLLSLGELFKNRVLRAVILLVLCFYTHISVSWFIALSYIFYAVMDKNYRRNSLRVVFYSLLIALPILLHQFMALHFIQAFGIDMPERFQCQIKVIDCILAFFGLALAAKMSSRHRLFIGMFLASIIFLTYPYRFFSGEGYLPVILLSALTMQALWQRLKVSTSRGKKILTVVLVLFILFISPTLSMDKPVNSSKIDYKIKWVDSALGGMFFAKGNSIWFPWVYLPTAEIIKANSSAGDIVYSNMSIVGLILGNLSQRATANALLPEIRSSEEFDPFLVAKIIVLSKDLDPRLIDQISLKYTLTKIKENKYFSIFKNPSSVYRLKVRKAAFSFWAIIAIFSVLACLFWGKKAKKLFDFVHNSVKILFL